MSWSEVTFGVFDGVFEFVWVPMNTILYTYFRGWWTTRAGTGRWFRCDRDGVLRTPSDYFLYSQSTTLDDAWWHDGEWAQVSVWKTPWAWMPTGTNVYGYNKNFNEPTWWTTCAGDEDDEFPSDWQPCTPPWRSTPSSQPPVTGGSGTTSAPAIPTTSAPAISTTSFCSKANPNEPSGALKRLKTSAARAQQDTVIALDELHGALKRLKMNSTVHMCVYKETKTTKKTKLMPVNL